MKPAQRRELVQYLRVGFKVSERRACRVIPIARATQRYQSQAQDQSALKIRLRGALWAMAQGRVRYGYRRLPSSWRAKAGRSTISVSTGCTAWKDCRCG